MVSCLSGLPDLRGESTCESLYVGGCLCRGQTNTPALCVYWCVCVCVCRVCWTKSKLVERRDGLFLHKNSVVDCRVCYTRSKLVERKDGLLIHKNTVVECRVCYEREDLAVHLYRRYWLQYGILP